jgi:DNA transformation protein
MAKPRIKTSALFPGIGPVTEKRLIEVGIKDLASLRRLGTVKAYQRLKFRYGKAVTLNALYGLEAVLLHCHWRAIPAKRKEELKTAAHRIPASVVSPSSTKAKP